MLYFRCMHCYCKMAVKDARLRGRSSFACAACNNARVAIIADFKKRGQMHVWNNMTKSERDSEIRSNRPNARGRGKKFQVTLSEKVACRGSRTSVFSECSPSSFLSFLS